MVNWELLAITAWSLWNNRNNFRHGGRSKRFDVIVNEAKGVCKGSKTSPTKSN